MTDRPTNNSFETNNRSVVLYRRMRRSRTDDAAITERRIARMQQAGNRAFSAALSRGALSVQRCRSLAVKRREYLDQLEIRRLAEGTNAEVWFEFTTRSNGSKRFDSAVFVDPTNPSSLAAFEGQQLAFQTTNKEFVMRNTVVARHFAEFNEGFDYFLRYEYS